MKLYYRAVSQDGKTVRGMIDAKDSKEVAFYLHQHHLLPIKIIEASKTGFAYKLPFLQRNSQKDLIFFTRQLASMFSSGLTLIQALEVMKNQSQKNTMDEMLKTIITDVENGKTLSSAMEKFPHFFSPIYIALIRTGEASGLLDKVLNRLIDNLEKEQRLKQAVTGALMYPAIVLVMMVVVVIIMMTVVIPQLSTLYGNLNITLPFATLVIVSLSEFTVTFWPVAVIGLIGGGFAFRRWYKTDAGRKLVDTTMLRIPLFGKLIDQAMTAEFTRTFGLLIGSGALIVESLMRTADIVGNVQYKAAISLVAKQVEKGVSVGEALEGGAVFPPMVVEMVKIGEQTGKLEDSLLRVSEYFEREVEQSVKTLTTLMEPLIMVFLALGVGFLIFAVITPIYNLMSAF